MPIQTNTTPNLFLLTIIREYGNYAAINKNYVMDNLFRTIPSHRFFRGYLDKIIGRNFYSSPFYLHVQEISDQCLDDKSVLYFFKGAYISLTLEMSLFLTRQILLADDDKDDQLLFKEALEELPVTTHLATVENGEQLMQLLNDGKELLPDILFLDLNMPRKNGFTCLSEIKRTEKLTRLPVIIFTTSYEPEIVNLLYKKGAQYYIRKPNDFEQLKKVIYQVLTLTGQKDISAPSRQNFELSSRLINDEAK